MAISESSTTVEPEYIKKALFKYALEIKVVDFVLDPDLCGTDIQKNYFLWNKQFWIIPAYVKARQRVGQFHLGTSYNKGVHL